MKLGLTFLLLLAMALVAGARPSHEALEKALAEAETFARAERWPDALKAGERLRTLCRELVGEDHSDTAAADLFLGEVRDRLGDHTLAEVHFRRAVAIEEKLLGKDAPELVVPLTRLAANLRQSRRLDEAAGLLELALAIQSRAGEDAATADAANNLARVRRAKGDTARAVELLERATAIRRRAFGGTAQETIDSLAELAQAQEAAGNLPAAELTTAERVVAVDAQSGGASREAVAALGDWARLAEQQERLTDAEVRYRRALAAAEKASFGDVAMLAPVLDALADCLRRLARPADARPLLERALAVRRQTLGSEHDDTAASCQRLGQTLRDLQDFAAARPLLEEALAIREKLSGPNDARTIETLADLGELEADAGRFDIAAQHLETRRYRAEEKYGAATAETAQAWQALAAVYERARRWPQAIQAALRSFELHEKLHGPADAATLGEMFALARICTSAGAFDPALIQFRRLATWFRQHPEADAATRAELLRQHAITAFRAGRRDEAGEIFSESRRVHETAFGSNDAATLRSLADLWTFYDETHQPARAVEVARDLVERTAAARGADAPATAEVVERLAQLCLSLGEKTEAERHFRRAADARQKHFGEGSPEHLAMLANIASWLEGARDFQAAIAWHSERLGVVGRKLGRDSEELPAACGTLAMCYFRQRDFRAARGMFQRQLELLTAREGADSLAALAALARLGDVAVAAGEWSEACRERERLAAGCARRFGRGHLEYARALLLLGEAQFADWKPAEATLRKAQGLIAPSDESELKARLSATLARVALRELKWAAALRETEMALRQSFGTDQALGDIFTELGRELLAGGEGALADRVLTAALSIQAPATGDHDERTLRLLKTLGTLRLQQAQPGAADLFARTVAASETVYGASAGEVTSALSLLVVAQVSERRFADAMASAERLQRDAPASPLAPVLAAWTRLLSTKEKDFESFAAIVRRSWLPWQPIPDLVLDAIATAWPMSLRSTSAPE